MEPIIAFNLLQASLLLRNAAGSSPSSASPASPPTASAAVEYVRNSIGLVTALNPVLGYERSAAIAKEALKTGGSVYDLVLQKGWLTGEQLDELLAPEAMTQPRHLSVRKD